MTSNCGQVFFQRKTLPHPGGVAPRIWLARPPAGPAKISARTASTARPDPDPVNP